MTLAAFVILCSLLFSAAEIGGPFAKEVADLCKLSYRERLSFSSFSTFCYNALIASLTDYYYYYYYYCCRIPPPFLPPLLLSPLKIETGLFD